ncbi:MAG: hypothetical protein ACLUES_02060 [Flavonifractor plautii]
MLILADGVIGTMMEPVVLPDEERGGGGRPRGVQAGLGLRGPQADYAHRAWISRATG